MKTKIATLSLLLTAGLAFGQQDEQGIVISGVEWATRNVADNGNFAQTPNDCGHYYKWNGTVGYPLGSIPPMNSVGDIAFVANPCPQDWRLPVWGEMSSMRSSGSTWITAGTKGVTKSGRFFGTGHATATIDNPNGAIFMPACGIFFGGNSEDYQGQGFYYYAGSRDPASNYIPSQWFTATANGGAGYASWNLMPLRCVRAEWLTIDGIEWAKSNVAAPGAFASRPDMQTPFYQWGRNEAQPTTGGVTSWNNTPETSTTAWTDNPCPANWRLPTFEEFQALTDEGYMWASAEYDDRGNAVDGIFLGRNAETCTLPDNMVGCIFLPANGLRNRTNGALGYEGMSAFYWSSEQANANNGRGLRADDLGGPGTVSSHKAFAYNIRCVHDVSITAGDEEPSSSSASNASILNITQASYSRALANYNRIAVDTISDNMLNVQAEVPNEIPNATLYPNPVANGQLTIDNGELAIGEVRVLTNGGVVVRVQDFGDQTTGTLQLQGLHGTYFIKVGNGVMQSIVVIN